MDCVYLSAGLSVRMKRAIPKQFITLLGKPIIVYGLEVIEKLDSVESIYVTYHPKFKKLYEDAIKAYNLSKCKLVAGGKTRQESVMCGLKHVKSEKVLIHEAARPIITVDFVKRLMGFDEKAVVPTIPIPFTVSQGAEFMEAELDRSKLCNIQLPQLFDTETLIKAHELARKQQYSATEDGILAFRLGEKVRFVPGLENNIKITTALDLILVESILRGEERW